jgi:hypothetical protein
MPVVHWRYRSMRELLVQSSPSESQKWQRGANVTGASYRNTEYGPSSQITRYPSAEDRGVPLALIIPLRDHRRSNRQPGQACRERYRSRWTTANHGGPQQSSSCAVGLILVRHGRFRCCGRLLHRHGSAMDVSADKAPRFGGAKSCKQLRPSVSILRSLFSRFTASMRGQCCASPPD